MALKTRTILDANNSVYLEHLDINEVHRTPHGTIPFRITKRRHHIGLSDGVDVVEVDNGRFSFIILLSKGMNLWRGRCGDVQLKWDSPVRGPVNPRHVPIYHPNGCGWLEGFDEWLVRCGLESNGAPEFDSHGVLKYPLHGRIGNLPARRVKVSFDAETGEIAVTGIVEEACLFSKRLAIKITYSTKAGSTKLHVRDEVINRSSVPGEFELLYHINTGFPFITPGAKIMVPFEKMTPRDKNAKALLKDWDNYLPETPDVPENCYLFDLAADRDANTRVMLINAQGNRGISLSFNKKEFPHFLIWKLMRPNGDTYVTGIEPCVNFPNTRSFEKAHGRVVPLAPGESRVFHLTFDVLLNEGDLSDAIHHIQRLQTEAAGTIIPDPIPEWCE